VADALTWLRTSEVVRAALHEELAGDLGLRADATLADLADGAPEPWPDLLGEHRTALCELAAEVDAEIAANRRLLQRIVGLLPAEQALQTLAGARQLSLHEFLA
jgi:hypothetical protein